MPPATPSIFPLLDSRPRIRVVDIGANPIDGDPPYAPLLRAGQADIVGFEPNRDALAALLQKKGPHETYLPHAIGDGKRHTLYHCQAPGMTSLLEPNAALLALFHGFPDWARVVRTEAVDTVRLDDVPETAGADLIKIDIQGAELMALGNAPERLAAALVEAGLAACVNVMAPCTSVYRWQGAVETASEVPVLIKTTAARYAELEAAIRARHPYELPEIVAVPFERGLAAYLDWVGAETRPPAG